VLPISLAGKDVKAGNGRPLLLYRLLPNWSTKS
jgi:hypothetical protein